MGLSLKLFFGTSLTDCVEGEGAAVFRTGLVFVVASHTCKLVNRNNSAYFHPNDTPSTAYLTPATEAGHVHTCDSKFVGSRRHEPSHCPILSSVTETLYKYLDEQTVLSDTPTSLHSSLGPARLIDTVYSFAPLSEAVHSSDIDSADDSTDCTFLGVEGGPSGAVMLRTAQNGPLPAVFDA